jgi:hypothetical protein
MSIATDRQGIDIQVETAAPQRAAGTPERFDPEVARRFLKHILTPDHCTELRIWRATFARTGSFILPAEQFGRTLGGWFDDIDKLICDLHRLNGVSGFVTLNPVDRNMLRRRDNAVGVIEKDKGTKDEHIKCLRWIYFDFDAGQPSDMSATDSEHEKAMELMAEFLADFPEIASSSIWGSSGNGGWLLCRLPDYPNDAEHKSLVKRTLGLIKRKYQRPGPFVDVKTFNPSRVMGIAGLMKCKGSNRPESPHRQATLESPDREPMPLDLAAWFAKNDDGVADEVKAPASDSGKHSRTASPTGWAAPQASLARRVTAYMAAMPPAISGQGGHDQTLKAATALVRGFALSADDAWLFLLSYNTRCQPPWTEAELRHKLDEAISLPFDKPTGYLFDEGSGVGGSNLPSPESMGGFVYGSSGASAGQDELDYSAEANAASQALATQQTFSNFRSVVTSGKDGESKSKAVPLALHEIDASLAACTPSSLFRRVGEDLFVETEDHQPRRIDKRSKFFSVILKYAGVEWKTGLRLIGQEEYYEHLCATAANFASIGCLPHEPKMPGVCYMHPEIPNPGGKLDELIGFFSPASAADRDLIRAFVVTAFWGGPPGRRPAFLLTSEANDSKNGVGVGKSTFVDVFAQEVFGGSVDVTLNDDMAGVVTRLLSPSAAQTRVIRIDNIKDHRLSWPELESLITSPEISGRALYRGEGRRPNDLMVCMTGNAASLSRDMAQRTIPITLARAAYRPGWEQEVKDFARVHRWTIIADALEILRREPTTTTAKTRWSDWEAGVLSKVARDLSACQRLIVAGQSEADVDEDEMANVRAAFAEKIRERGHRPESAHVLIPSEIAADWLSDVLRKKFSSPGSTTHLMTLCVPELSRHRDKYGRGWAWLGTEHEGPVGQPDDLRRDPMA